MNLQDALAECPVATYGTPYLRQLNAVLPPQIVVWAVGGVGASDMESWWAAAARALKI